MDKIKNYLKSRWWILLITLVFFLIRLPFLDQFSLLPDERDLALTSYSLARTGNDLFGNHLPLIFNRISPHSPFIPIYYGAIWWLLPIFKNVFNARFIFLLPASLLPLLVYEIVLYFSKEKTISLLTTIIFSFSPWIYHVSRLGLEINLALPLFLASILFQINNKKFLSYFFYSLTFFTYQGIRLLVIILPLYLELYAHIINKAKIKFTAFEIGKYLILLIVLFLFSINIEKNIQTRSSFEIIFFNLERLSAEVNFYRNISSAPFFVKQFFDNKVILMVYYLSNNFLKGIDFSYLFHLGDYVAEFNNGVVGQFYLLFALFLPLGFVYLFINKKKLNYYLLASLTIIGLIPSVINSYSLTFSIRSSFAALGFSFLIGCGIIYSYNLIKKYSKLIIILNMCFFSILLLFQMSYFFYHYFYSRPQLFSELFYERERKLAQYLLSKNKFYEVKVPLPNSSFFSYLFFYPLKKSDYPELNKVLKNNLINFKFNSVKFTDCGNPEKKTVFDLKNTIISESCLLPGEKFLLESTPSAFFEKIYYSSFAPFDFNKKTAYYIFDR